MFLGLDDMLNQKYQMCILANKVNGSYLKNR